MEEGSPLKSLKHGPGQPLNALLARQRVASPPPLGGRSLPKSLKHGTIYPLNALLATQQIVSPPLSVPSLVAPWGPVRREPWRKVPPKKSQTWPGQPLQFSSET